MPAVDVIIGASLTESTVTVTSSDSHNSSSKSLSQTVMVIISLPLKSLPETRSRKVLPFVDTLADTFVPPETLQDKASDSISVAFNSTEEPPPSLKFKSPISASTGASLTGFTVRTNSSVSDSSPSETVICKVALPFRFAAGVKVIVLSTSETSSTLSKLCIVKSSSSETVYVTVRLSKTPSGVSISVGVTVTT